jgi:two-component system, NtrC family, sensor kinase
MMGSLYARAGRASGKDYSLRGRSLRQKAVWTMVGVMVYFAAAMAVIAYERGTLIDSIAELEQVHGLQQRQVALNMSVSRAVMAVNENYFAPNIEESAKVLILEIEAVLSGLSRMAVHYPSLSDDISFLNRGIGELSRVPSRGAIAELRGGMHRLVIALDGITSDINSRNQRQLQRYRSTFDRLTLEWTAFVVIGVAVVGGVAMFFMRRLAEDIASIRRRAVAIVGGYRGEALKIERDDELGSLIEAINDMQSDLRDHESEIEIARQQQFHKEKMAAVGSLAAAVAHEINNPLSAIVGVAQAIDKGCQIQHCSLYENSCHPKLILDQATRVMQITRKISEFSVPQSPEAELLDLNGLLRSTCNFISFDRRFRLLELTLDLDSTLPAVLAVGDQLVQVAMNLLINAGDALEGHFDPSPKIELRSWHDSRKVFFSVSDNGIGVEPMYLDEVFNQHFTTKGAGRGSGLGLFLCRELIRGAGGDITLNSEVGIGTVVTVSLPVPLTIGDQDAEAVL